MKAKFPKWRVNGNEGLCRISPNLAAYPEAMDLFTQMMQMEPSKRISAKAALDHPFFK
jgi:cyclin-dependent kinase